MHFKKHYTRDEARELLPQVRGWLGEVQALRDELARQEVRVASLMQAGHDIGGNTVNIWLKTFADMRVILNEFNTREIQIKDLDRGLVDFPAIVQGREVFLCWEQGEEDIEFWHDLEAGYPGRERL
ncbi:MAG TPA: DUF2203 domain-containing protein [Verrucomicrobiae bacterium]|jgi:hypothetical protein